MEIKPKKQKSPMEPQGFEDLSRHLISSKLVIESLVNPIIEKIGEHFQYLYSLDAHTAQKNPPDPQTTAKTTKYALRQLNN